MERSGIRDQDQLNFYSTGEMYDCTFKFRCNDSDTKIFKCHKVILAMASSVFQTMFESNFKEGKGSKGKDEAIALKDVPSAAFDIAMRFIYGNCKDFGDIVTAVQVYRFAHQMQIISLLAPLDQYIENYQTGPEEVFAIFDVYTLIDNDEALQKYWKILETDAKAAFESTSWLKVSSKTVENILNDDFELVKETDLFRALLNWGRAQVLLEKNIQSNITDLDADKLNEIDLEVRTKIYPVLKSIRFAIMDPKDFAEICKSCNVLTNDEKLKVFMCINLNSSEYLPTGLTPTEEVEKMTNVNLQFKANEGTPIGIQSGFLNFSIDREAYLVGLKIDESDKVFGNALEKNINISLFQKTPLELLSSFYCEELDSRGCLIIKLKETKFPLKKDVMYYLKFSLPAGVTMPNVSTYYTIALDNQHIIDQPSLTVTIEKNNTPRVNVARLMFCQ